MPKFEYSERDFRVDRHDLVEPYGTIECKLMHRNASEVAGMP